MHHDVLHVCYGHVDEARDGGWGGGEHDVLQGAGGGQEEGEGGTGKKGENERLNMNLLFEIICKSETLNLN